MTSCRLSGPHQKSSGSTRLMPSTMKATTRPTFDGLNRCEPRYLMTYLVSSEKAATPAKIHQPSVVQGWSGGVPTTRRMRATPLPVSIALAGHTKALLERKVRATSMIAVVRMAARIWGTLTRKCSPSWPSTWMVMITEATCRRGSRRLGRKTG